MLSFVVPLFVIRCTTRCHWLSLAVIYCHSLSLVVPLLFLLVLPVVPRCHSLYHSLPFVVTRCTARCHLMYTRLYKQSYSRWRKLTQMNRHWTGKLQVTLLFSYIFWEKLCSHTFKASSKEVMVMTSEKMKAKYIKEDVWKRFFYLPAGISQLLYELTFSQKIFRDFKGMKTFKLLLFGLIWLYLLVKIQQLVHEISSFPELSYKKNALKNFSKFTNKHIRRSSQKLIRWSSHPQVFCQKIFLNILQN